MTSSIDPRVQAWLARAGALPAPTAAAGEVLRLCQRDDANPDEIAAVLARDATLTGRVLAFASSRAFGAGGPARTPARAVHVLGTKTLRLLTSTLTLFDALPHTGGAAGLEFEAHWRHALLAAASARALAARLAPALQDEAFVLALHARSGQLVLACHRTHEYAALVEEARRGPAASDGLATPAAELEQARLGFDHVDVADALFAPLELPRVFALALRAARAPSSGASGASGDLPAELTLLAQVLALAERVTELVTGTGGTNALARAQEQARRAFECEASELDLALASLDDDAHELAELLGLPAPAPGELTRALAAARDAARGRGSSAA